MLSAGSGKVSYELLPVIWRLYVGLGPVRTPVEEELFRILPLLHQ